MRVVLDLVRVTQQWDPDTNTQTNTAELRIGNEILDVPVTEAQLTALIATGAQQKQEAEPVEDYGLYEEGPGPELTTNDEGSFELPTNADGHRVFGGDVGKQDHSLFKSLDTDDLPEQRPVVEEPPKSSTQQRLDSIQETFADRPISQRMDKKAEMRARARSVPAGKVQKDEMGYPIVSKKLAPAAAPEVVQKDVLTNVEESDDLFDQG